MIDIQDYNNITMTTTFLAELSAAIKKSGIALEETFIILPNKRAGRILFQHLACSDKPVFAPEILTIDEFISHLSPLKDMEQTETLALLFEAQQTLSPAIADDFNEMLSWAPAFLSDIEEIDMQLQDGEYVFRTLAFDKEFSLAMSGHSKDSKAMQGKMERYSLFGTLYTTFHNKMREAGKSYPGFRYRDCAENIEAYASHPEWSSKHFIFAGFHVFSPAEIAVVKHIKDHYDTVFYFDIDPFYCDFSQDDRFTTAFFLRKICRELELAPERLQFCERHFESTDKHIQVVGTSQNVNQIYFAIEKIEEIRKRQGNLDSTAVVLADESLLVPFLSAYAHEDANVTMGYPFSSTPAYTMLNTLLELYGAATALRLHSSEKLRYHRRDLSTLLHNPLVKRYAFNDLNTVRNTVNDIARGFKVLYTQSELPEGTLPAFTTAPSHCLPALVNYTEHLLQQAVERESQRNAAMLSLLADALRKTQDTLQQLNVQDIDFASLKYLIGLQAGSISLPVTGGSLQGLQIMGLLETRTLDFDNVILLSVNEGILPKGISQNTLLPFELKYDAQSLPGYLYKDQVYAYHFFRLLQRAKDITLLYNSSVSDGTLNEKSRLIAQLEFMVTEKRLENIEIKYVDTGLPYQPEKRHAITVEKNDEIIGQIRNFKFSPTSFNKYLNCPLQFYFSCIRKINAPDTFCDITDSNIIGEAVHNCYCDVFNKIKQSPADYANIIDDFIREDNLYGNIRKKLLDNKNLKLNESDLASGRPYLAIRIISNDVRSYLTAAKKELEAGGITILGNEQALGTSRKIDGFDIRLEGEIDRIQDENGILTVLDYKTGSVQAKLKAYLNEPESVFDGKDHDQFVQLLFYMILCRHSDNEIFKDIDRQNCRYKSGIISIKEANKQNSEYLHYAVISSRKGEKKDIHQTFDNKTLDVFENEMDNILKKLLDKENPFFQTTEEKHCKYCDFKVICNRQ